MKPTVLLFFWTISLQAAINPVVLKPGAPNSFISEGVIVGGESKTDISLIDVRRDFSSKQKTERIVLEMKATKTQLQRPAYYHVAVRPQQNKVVIDIEGVGASEKPINELIEKLKLSPIIKQANLTLDPQDRSATIELIINSHSIFDVKAQELKPTSGAARLAIDIRAKTQGQKQ